MSDSVGLQVEGLTVRFGGNTAVSEVDLEAPLGRITGLIGPNGAGKTTIFNTCSGLQRPTAGRVHFGGRDITDLPPHRRAQLGIGRTFQRMELFDSLTVSENVALGREAGDAGSRPLSHLRATRAERAALFDVVDEALVACGIESIADRDAASLSTGQRRLVELARAMTARSTLLLLDEPSSGLDHRETAAFGDILLGLVSARGVGLLLVEHDMELVMRVCDHLFVLDFGQRIFDGAPAEVAASPIVRAAYLGDAIDDALSEVPS